jgi:hypothetical protein
LTPHSNCFDAENCCDARVLLTVSTAHDAKRWRNIWQSSEKRRASVFLSVILFPSDAKAFCGANITQRFHVFIVVIFKKNSCQNWQTKKSIIFCHRIDPFGSILWQKNGKS